MDTPEWVVFTLKRGGQGPFWDCDQVLLDRFIGLCQPRNLTFPSLHMGLSLLPPSQDVLRRFRLPFHKAGDLQPHS